MSRKRFLSSSRQASPGTRRLSNQFFFDKLLVKEDKVVGAIHAEPFSTLLAEEFIKCMRRNAANPGRVSLGRGSRMTVLVGRAGLEPATGGL